VGTTVLLVTEQPLSEADVSSVLAAGSASPADVTVLVAVPQHATARSTQSVIDGLEMDVASSRGEKAIHLPEQQTDPASVALADAEQVVTQVVAALTAAGAQATGEVTPRHPLETIGDILEEKKVDDVVVMVQGHHLKGALHGDLAARIQRHFDVPVLRVHTHA
jgi:nucleotide-binding universal stress UspA family protein